MNKNITKKKIFTDKRQTHTVETVNQPQLVWRLKVKLKRSCISTTINEGIHIHTHKRNKK